PDDNYRRDRDGGWVPRFRQAEGHLCAATWRGWHPDPLAIQLQRRRQRAQFSTEHSPAVERHPRRALRWHVKRHIIFIGISAVLLVTFGWGQDAHTVPASAIGPELPYTEVLTLPMPVNS